MNFDKVDGWKKVSVKTPPILNLNDYVVTNHWINLTDDAPDLIFQFNAQIQLVGIEFKFKISAWKEVTEGWIDISSRSIKLRPSSDTSLQVMFLFIQLSDMWHCPVRITVHRGTYLPFGVKKTPVTCSNTSTHWLSSHYRSHLKKKIAMIPGSKSCTPLYLIGNVSKILFDFIVL